MADTTVHVDLIITDAGECPMCMFDTLRKISGHTITRAGVSTVFAQLICGRCINDLRESL